jgi:hypothetical protein
MIPVAEKVWVFFFYNDTYDGASNSETFIRNEANYRFCPLHWPCGVRTLERGSLKMIAVSMQDKQRVTAHTRDDE